MLEEMKQKSISSCRRYVTLIYGDKKNKISDGQCEAFYISNSFHYNAATNVEM